MKLKRNIPALLAALSLAVAGSPLAAEKLTIATVNNGDMITMQKLSSAFERDNPDIELEWLVLEESVLRQRVTQDIATSGGQFDIMTIGAYETPLWGKKGWLVPLDDFGADYDYDDMVPSIRNALSVDGKLFAAPFYAESSFTMYRADLFEKAGLKMPDNPTYEQIRGFAAKLHDPGQKLYGICVRGKPGWGDNMAYVTTIVNTFGGRWFDENWRPQLESPEWKTAVNFYVDMLNNYGPPGSSSNSFNEILALFSTGNCAMWIDATVAAGFLYDPKRNNFSDVTAVTNPPVAVTPRGSGWSWAWSLAIPKSSEKTAAAKKFIKWATSKEYIRMVGETNGWVTVPPGTRKSTYANPKYQAAAPFADFVLQAIENADPNNPTAKPVPYTGVQFAAIDEFQSIGAEVGQLVAGALAGDMSVDEALAQGQRAADRAMRQAGYY